jgi:cytochrome c biogenesis protein ResB
LRTRSRFDLLALGTAMMILVTLVAVVAIVGGVFAPGLRELHATWWFRALLAWSCIALAVCGLRELVELCASLCGRGFRWRRPSGTVLVRELRGPTAERMHSRLREFGYRVSRWDAGGDRIVEGVKGWIGWAGRGLVHCGLAVILLGGGVQAFLGKSDTYVVAEGQRFGAPAGDPVPVLSAEDLRWEPNAGTLRLQVLTPPAGSVAEPQRMSPGHAVRVRGGEVRLLSIGPSVTRFRSAEVLAKHFDGWEQLLELRADVPGVLRDRDTLTAVAYVARGAVNRFPAGPALHVKVTHGDSTTATWVTPWEGFGGVSGPWRFTLVGVTPEAEATVVVRTIPGDPLVASGLVAFVVGVVCSVSYPLRRAWAVIAPSGCTTLGAHGPLAGRAWHEEVGRLAGAFTRAAGEDAGENL